jgi:hypothetical protein
VPKFMWPFNLFVPPNSSLSFFLSFLPLSPLQKERSETWRRVGKFRREELGYDWDVKLYGPTLYKRLNCFGVYSAQTSVPDLLLQSVHRN